MATLKKQSSYVLEINEEEAILLNTLFHHINSDGKWGLVAEEIFSLFYNEKIPLLAKMLPENFRENGLTLKDTE